MGKFGNAAKYVSPTSPNDYKGLIYKSKLKVNCNESTFQNANYTCNNAFDKNIDSYYCSTYGDEKPFVNFSFPNNRVLISSYSYTVPKIFEAWMSYPKKWTLSAYDEEIKRVVVIDEVLESLFSNDNLIIQRPVRKGIYSSFLFELTPAFNGEQLRISSIDFFGFICGKYGNCPIDASFCIQKQSSNMKYNCILISLLLS